MMKIKKKWGREFFKKAKTFKNGKILIFKRFVEPRFEDDKNFFETFLKSAFLEAGKLITFLNSF